MSSNIYTTGLRNDGSYKVSGQPFVVRKTINVGQEVKVEFPYVAKNVTVRIPKPPNSALQKLGQSGWFVTSTSGQPNRAGVLPEFGTGSTSYPFSDGTTAARDWTLSFFLSGSRTLGSSAQDRVFIQFMSGNSTGNFNTAVIQYQSAGHGGLPDGIGIDGSANNQYVFSGSPFKNKNLTNNMGGTFPSGFEDGNYHHILITQKTGSTFLYIDGVSTSTTDQIGVTNEIRVGWNGAPVFRNQTFGDMIFFLDGFTNQEVQEIRNSGEFFNPKFHSKKSTLVAWWTWGDHHLDKGPGHPPFGNMPSASMGPQDMIYDAADDPTTEHGDENFNLQRYQAKNSTNFPFNPAVHVGGIMYSVPGPFTSQTTGKIRVHTLSTGSASGANIVANNHYKELQGYGESYTFSMKGKEIYISGLGAQTTVEIIAELTNIPTGSMYALTGSGIDE